MNGLDCATCTEQLRQFRGHYGSPPRTIEGIEVTKCPLLYVTEIEKFQLEAFRQYKNGYLPDVGGWLDQPLKFIHLMGFIDNAVDEITEKREHGNERT